MTYEDLLLINNKVKNNSKFNNSIKRIHIDDRVSILDVNCNISCNGETETIQIKELIGHISNGKCYLSNPSILSHWHFNQQDIIKLWHGSPNPILRPVFGEGKDKHDYGKGLYFTPDKELAKEWAVSGGTDGYLYEINLDITELRILDYDRLHPFCWLAELMSHRDADKSVRYRRFAPYFIKEYKKDTSKYDIIKGWRADSSYFLIAKKFVKDELDVSLLPKVLKLGDLGIQYCIKSKKAFEKLKQVYNPIESVSYNEYFQRYNERDTKARHQLMKIIESEENTMLDVFSNYVKRG